MKRARHEDAVAYLLGELGSEEAPAFERRLAEDAELRAEVDRLRPVVHGLETMPAAAWEAVDPPPLMLPADVRAEEAVRDSSGMAQRPARSRRRRWTLRPAVAALCGLALLAIGVGAGLLLGAGDETAAPAGTQLALAPVGEGPRSGRAELVVRDAGKAIVSVDVSGLRATGRRQFYELWLLGADQRLVALGSFRVGSDGRASMELPLPVDPAGYQYFDVSLQPANGNPGHSGRSVLRGPSLS